MTSPLLTTRRRRGATSMEYALIAGLMALVIVWAVVDYSESLADLLQFIADNVNPVL